MTILTKGKYELREKYIVNRNQIRYGKANIILEDKTIEWGHDKYIWQFGYTKMRNPTEKSNNLKCILQIKQTTTIM